MAMQAIRTRRMAWIALVAVVLVLAFNGPSEARGGGGGGHAGGGAHVGGGHPSGGHFNAHHFEGGRFHHGWRGGYHTRTTEFIRTMGMTPGPTTRRTIRTSRPRHGGTARAMGRTTRV